MYAFIYLTRNRTAYLINRHTTTRTRCGARIVLDSRGRTSGQLVPFGEVHDCAHINQGAFTNTTHAQSNISFGVMSARPRE